MRRFLLLLCSFLAYQTLNAESVSKSEALRKAQSFMPGKHFVESKPMASTRGEASSDAFYVFNADNGGGYVIVSGDDRTTEILGYSRTGNIDMDRLPENLKWWLDGYVRQIEALGTSVKPVKKAKTRGSDNWNAIEPLIQTKWNQDVPYNLMCPDSEGRVWTDEGFATDEEGVYSLNNICVTGCVATAMAQMLYYYHKNPNLPSTFPALDGYETRTYGWSMKALPATTFDWDAMKLSYNRNETGASATAIATLMRYCGQSVSMDYSLGASEASVDPLVLINVFGFSKNIRNIYRDVYTTSQWEEIIYAELEAGRPVLYSGQADDGGGHQFIVDGYDGNGLFHMNWGWGSLHDDEYFVLSLADPDGQGIGGSATNSAFQFRQDALIGVEPGGSEEKMMPQIESYIDLTAQDYSRTDADADFTDVQFVGTFYAHYNVPSTEGISVQVGWALCQNGLIQKVFSLDEYYIAEGKLSPGNDANLEVTFGAGMALGKYEVSMVYKYREDAEWSLCSPYHYTNFFIAEVTETTLTIRQVQPSFAVNSITVPEYPGTDSPLDVTLNVTNDGETFEQVIWLWAQKEGEAMWTRVATATRKIDPGKSDDVVMSFIPSVAGDYTLKATKADSEEALKSATVTIYASFEKTINNVTYFCNVGTKKAKVIGNTISGNDVAVSIPSTIDDDGIQFTVTEIADGAFKFCYPMTSLTIPSTVESIGNSAVYNCYMLSEIKIPEGVLSIGSRAFQYCQWVETIELPASLTSIGEYAFGNLEYLTCVVSSVTNPFAIADNVFGVEADDILTAPTATLVVPIGSKESYEETAGWMKFPITYQGEVKEFTENDITYTYYTGEDFAIVKKGDQTALEDKDVVIPSAIQVDEKSYNIKKIAECAFNQVAMKSLTIEPGVEEISDYAFYNAYIIAQIIIPKGVKSIGAYAFRYCNRVKTIELPASLTSIGEYAFGNICKLEWWESEESAVSVVSYITSPFAIADNVFGVEDDNGILTAPTATLTVPAGSKESYEKTAGWKEFTSPIEMEAKPGDVNVDYEVDEKDLEAIAEYIMAGQYEKKADLNNDNKVNAADIVEIVKIIKK